ESEMTTEQEQVTESRREAYVIACLVQGEWERALEVIEEVGPWPGYAPQLASTSGRLLGEQQAEAALRVARPAVELDPDCAPAQTALGRVLLATGDTAAAEAALRRAAELDPAALAARIELITLLVEQERPLEGVSYAEQAVETAPWAEEARE